MAASDGRSPRLSIRLKLIGAFAPLLVGLGGVTAVEVWSAWVDRRDVREQTALAEASLGPLSLLNALERERNAASIHLLGLEGAVTLEVEDNAEARALTDEAAEQLRDGLGGLKSVGAAYEAAFDRLVGLRATREWIDAFDQPRTPENAEVSALVFELYSAVSEEVYAANENVTVSIDDPSVRTGAELALLSARQSDLTARIVRVIVVAEIGGTDPDGLDDPLEIADLAALRDRLRGNEEQLRAASTGIYEPNVSALLQEDEVRLMPGLVDEALRTGRADIGEVLSTATGDDGPSAYTVFREGVADVLRDEASDRERDAVALARLLAGLTLVAVVLALTIAVFVASSITRPLAAVARQARDMAHRRLPAVVLDIRQTPPGTDIEVRRVQPIEVRARDEVVDVASALTSVQDTAVGLAVEQAVLRRNIADVFLHMGRRNQNLVTRQLELVTELERGERDPDNLANLFGIDHLATRIRRNAESLLVLAGVDPPRRRARPVGVAEIIRAAVGEVEHYERVIVHGIAPAAVAGSATSDIAHVLAELIENALSYSPADTTVEIRGAPTGQSYRIAVIDNGMGMTPTEIDQANRRLSGTESYTVAPSRYLGHYVAGHLAARHGVQVRLQPSSGRGVTALMELPPALVAPSPDDEPPLHTTQQQVMTPPAHPANHPDQP